MNSREDRQAATYEQLIDVTEAARSDRNIGAASPAVTLLRLFKDGRWDIKLAK